MKYLYLIVYKLFAQYLPSSGRSKISKYIRYFLCKKIFLKCGNNVNIERRANFGTGFKLIIGNNSGIGIECVIPNNIIIGNNVLMGPKTYIFGISTHEFSSTKKTIREQGRRKINSPIIEDDVWIGRQVLINHSRTIRKGTIIAAGSVVTKDFPEYSIIGGNPAKLIRMRDLNI